MKNIVIGIAGGTASGKTTIARAIGTSFSEDDVVIIRQDNYYKSQHHLSLEERISVDYDHPNAFDFDLLCTHMNLLRNGIEISQPLYDFTKHIRSDETTCVKPGKVIIVEGILVFADERLLKLMDIKVFVDTEADLRFIRRLLRDTVERQRTLDQSITQYLATAKPGHDQFVEPSKKKADIIIPYKDHNTVAIDMLIDQINYIITKND
ncbi:MAG: uridine kinase [Brevinemataceae bacterium]